MDVTNPAAPSAPVVSTNPVSAPAATDTPPPTDAQVVAAEDNALTALSTAQAAAAAAAQAVVTATQTEAQTKAALGVLVNQRGGLGIVNPDGTIRVLLADGNGGFHPIVVAGVNTTVTGPSAS